MLQQVAVGRWTIEAYREHVPAGILEELRELAHPLRGARVLHINATSYGGGVSELLRSVIPLLRDLGIAAEWRVIGGRGEFFSATKSLHNALQGASAPLTEQEQAAFVEVNAENARSLEGSYDFVIVHDPQPAAILQQPAAHGARWVWRCHIDTSEPNRDAWSFLRPFLASYDAAVFTMPEFAPPDFPLQRIAIIPPAIDPLSPKNIELRHATERQVVEWIGVDPDAPLITQVSRFDPWKDPLGVIDAYRMVRAELGELQLALVGSMALDDPEGWEVYRKVTDAAGGDPLIHVYTNLTGVGNIEVNAFQRLSEVVVQKSIREGFGLVVSESLWKATPVVAGRAGGIPLQMPEGTGGYLVDSVESCAARLIELLQDPVGAKALGRSGREHVREHFLLPRLLADELRLLGSLA